MIFAGPLSDDSKPDSIIQVLAESAPDTGEWTVSPVAVFVPTGSRGQILQAVAESANGVQQPGTVETSHLVRQAIGKLIDNAQGHRW